MNWHDIFATRMGRMKASEIRELLKLLDQPDIISFAGGIPDPALFPRDAFQAAMAEALSPQNAGNALQYSVSEGYGPLRDWIVEEMAVLCDAIHEEFLDPTNESVRSRLRRQAGTSWFQQQGMSTES